VIVFNWKYPDGSVENWWGSAESDQCSVSGDRYASRCNRGVQRRFVYNAFKAKRAIAIHLEAREIQITHFATGEREHLPFDGVSDPDLRDAMHIVADAPDAGVRFLVVMYLNHVGHVDLADEISQGRANDLETPA
jgi:hypothetical protein